jgi:hypothetical protein
MQMIEKINLKNELKEMESLLEMLLKNMRKSSEMD